MKVDAVLDAHALLLFNTQTLDRVLIQYLGTVQQTGSILILSSIYTTVNVGPLP